MYQQHIEFYYVKQKVMTIVKNSILCLAVLLKRDE